MVQTILKKPGNRVHLEEAAKCIIKSEQFSDLVFLYEHHNLHEKG